MDVPEHKEIRQLARRFLEEAGPALAESRPVASCKPWSSEPT